MSQPTAIPSRVTDAEFRRNDFVGKNIGGLFTLLCFGAALMALAALALLLFSMWRDGNEYLTFDFLAHYPSRFADKAGLYPALMGTVWLMGCTVALAVPVGIGAAIYLEEFAPKNRLTAFINLNIGNLAGVPSIVYGLLGLALFVRFCGLGRSVLAGSLTLSLLIMPVIVTATREALKAVPDSLRHAALGVGGSRWQVIWHHVLPAAAPGALTGMILSLSRAVGETAPLAVLGAFAYVSNAPAGVRDKFTALPLQIYYWAGLPQKEFHAVAASGILVLLAVLLVVNAAAVFLRNRFARRRAT